MRMNGLIKNFFARSSTLTFFRMSNEKAQLCSTFHKSEELRFFAQNPVLIQNSLFSITGSRMKKKSVY